MSIYGVMEEYEKLESELNRLNARRKQLTTRLGALKQTVNQYLTEKNKPGIKNPRTGFVIQRQETIRRKPKKKDKKRADCIQVLRASGVKNSDEVFDALESARQGEKYKDYTLRT